MHHDRIVPKTRGAGTQQACSRFTAVNSREFVGNSHELHTNFVRISREAVGGVLPAHFLHCGSHLGGAGGHAVHIDLLATGHHGHPQAGGHCGHLAGACLGLGMPGLCAGHEVPDTGSSAPPLSPRGAGASAPSALSTASAGCAAGFALRNVATSRSRVLTLVASRSRSLVTSANRNSQSRLSSLALDRRASRRGWRPPR